MSNCKLFSLAVMVSLLLVLLATITPLVEAAPKATTDYSPPLAPQLNINKGLGVNSLESVSADDMIGSDVSLPCNTYYLNRNTVNVGTDGEQKIAIATAPLASTPEVASKQLNFLSGFTEIARFYSDPMLAADLSIKDISGSLWVQAGQSNTTFKVEMFDYNPVNGTKILLGDYNFGLISTEQTEISFDITPATTTIPAGHRFLLVLSGDANALLGDTVSLFYDSTTSPSQFLVCQPISATLSISKSGPANVGAGQLIDYTLTIANSGDITATNLIISDTIPSGANYVSGGTKVGNVVRWTTNSLAPHTGIQVTFAVTAAATIVNNAYKVVANNNVSAVGQEAVVTIITSGPIKKLYLPTVFKSEPQTFLIIISYETGGINPVQILDPNNNNQLLSCVIGNNVTENCGYFPAIGTYKIVAYTNNCGVLQGIFHDATPGATVTRRVHCR